MLLLCQQISDVFLLKTAFSTIDRINSKMCRESIKLASEVFARPWKMKQGNKSPNYTTSWDGLVVV